MKIVIDSGGEERRGEESGYSLQKKHIQLLAAAFEICFSTVK